MIIDDIFIGQSCSISKSFSEKDVLLFSELSLDRNPVHVNKEYAEQSLFKKQIVHGFLSSSLISAVLGTELPGPGAIYLHQDMDFKKPIYLDETVTAKVTVMDIKIEKSIIYLKTECYNSKGELSVDGSAIVKLI